MRMQPEQVKLNAVDRAAYYKLITEELLTSDTLSDSPRAVFLAGQPGAGKTKLRVSAKDEVPSVVINTDDLREYHPGYRDLKLSDPERASFLVNADASLWTEKLIGQTSHERRNLIVDGTFGSSNGQMIRDTLTGLKGKGYRIEIWALAVPAQLSKLGIYLRNELQIKHTGHGRMVSMKVHDLNYTNIANNIAMAVSTSLPDKVCIFTRAHEKIDNQIVNNDNKLDHELSRGAPNFIHAGELFRQAREDSLTPLLLEYMSNRTDEVTRMIDHRLQKCESLAEKQSLQLYKQGFLAAMNDKARDNELTM